MYKEIKLNGLTKPRPKCWATKGKVKAKSWKIGFRISYELNEIGPEENK